MRLNFLAVVLFHLPVCVHAQDSVSDAYPRDGVERLALFYLRTDFDHEQRQRLSYARLELIFLVDTTGYATLEEVNGIDDRDIIDSLLLCSNIPPFVPAREGGKLKEDLYVLHLEFPAYEPVHISTQRFGNIPMTEIEDIEKSGHKIHILFGGVGNTFAGNPSRYLSAGGGAKLDMIWEGRKSFGFGLTMCVYGNHAHRKYPVQTTRRLDSAPTTFIFGVVANRKIFATDRREMNVQFELDYAGQNVSTRENADDDDYIQFDGFSPGLLLNYSIQLGAEHFQNTYYPGLTSHHLNIHAGVRPLFLDFKAARGVMFEIGVAYRITNSLVSAIHYR